MKYLIIIITILLLFIDLSAEEILSNSQIREVYEKFCYFADTPFASDSLLKYYSILDRNKDILSEYIQQELKSDSKMTHKRYMFMVSGIFKLRSLEDDIRKLQSFDILFFLTQTFYFYQISNDTQYLELLKQISNLNVNADNRLFIEAKIFAVDLLGWINDDSVHDFLIGINKEGLVDAYSTIYEDSLERIKILKQIPSN